MKFNGNYISSGVGQMEDHDNTRYAVIGNNVGHFYVGSQNPSSFEGQVDEIKIYNRALSEEEVRMLYESER